MFSYSPLWQLLAKHRLKKYTFARNSSISRTTLDKICADKYVDMKTLDKICNYFNCEIEDIVQHIKE